MLADRIRRRRKASCVFFLLIVFVLAGFAFYMKSTGRISALLCRRILSATSGRLSVDRVTGNGFSSLSFEGCRWLVPAAAGEETLFTADSISLHYNIVDILTKANPYIRAQIAKPEFDLSVFMHAGREFLIPEKIKNVRCRLLDGALYAREDLLLADAISGDVSLSGDDIILSSLKGSSFAGDISLEGAYEAATLLKEQQNLNGSASVNGKYGER